MKKELEKIRDDFMSAIKDVKTSEELEKIRVEFLGRKGKIAEVMKGLPALSVDLKKEVGQFGNEIKREIENAFLKASVTVKLLEDKTKRQEEWVDITQPGRKPKLGSLHLVTQAIEEVEGIFERMGFVRVRYPEIDWDWYAFEALNMPKNHAARDEWETFFVKDPTEDKVLEGKKGKMVLTPHTTNGLVRELEKEKLPIRMLSIGKTYRRQSDMTHVPMFHQFEGLLVDENVTIAELKGIFDFFVKNYFGEERKIRLRPHHFRFTEPSFELDIDCNMCHGAGIVDGKKCRTCKQGWLELGGAGMVHPNVLRAGGIDPEKYSGLAFGWGVERTLTMKSGINIGDLRVLFKNDLRFLKQF